jgi:hypothetical protein
MLHAQEPVCPLTDEQTKDAIDAFTALAPLFLEPRCFNCHGGVSPFGTGRNHPAETGFKIIRDPSTGLEDVQATFAPCQECHGPLPGPPPGWRLAPALPPGPNMQFRDASGAPKSALQLCRQMKNMFPNQADRFIAHMTNDEGGTPFLDVAFAGTLDLNPEGLERAENDGVKVPDPPRSMTRSQALEHAKDWVQAMNDQFYDPDDCGCAPLQYGLRVRLKGEWVKSAGGENVRYDWGNPTAGQELPIIPIAFHKDGSVTGDTRYAAAATGSALGRVWCAVGGTQVIHLVAHGVWPHVCTGSCNSDSSERIRVTLNAGLDSSQASATCEALGHTAHGSSNYKSNQGFAFDYQLDPVVEATQSVPWNVPLPGFTGAAQVTVVRLK